MKNRELANYVQRMINKAYYKKETDLKAFKALMLNLKQDLQAGKSKAQLQALHKKAFESYGGLRKRANRKVVHDMFIDLKHRIRDISERK